jgi:hypothetical protein
MLSVYKNLFSVDIILKIRGMKLILQGLLSSNLCTFDLFLEFYE